MLATKELEATAAIDAAREKLRLAREKFAKADDEFNGPQRRYHAAQKELWDADAAVKTIERGGRI